MLTDFGLDDYYVAAVKGVVLSRAPQTTLVDISHQVPPGDVAQAAFLLAAAVPTFPAQTLHLAVVDPGVGSARRILLVEREEQLFLAPDNGLLTPLLTAEARVRAVSRDDLFRPGPGQTFHGRDRFAPLAAALLTGTPPARLGLLIDDPVRLPESAPERHPDRLVGQVVHVDRFGNLVTDVPADWLPSGPFTAEISGHSTSLRVSHYAELPAGAAAVLTGSLGTLEFSLSAQSLAAAWQVGRGCPVVIRCAEQTQRRLDRAEQQRPGSPVHRG